MTFERYWAVLVKRRWLVIVCFVIVGLGTYVGSLLLTPLYQSAALIEVALRSSNDQADLNSLMASEQLIQTESLLAVSDPVLREVASHYPALTVEQLAKEVTATARLNTQLFEIDVVDASPARAAALANDVAATLIKQQLQVIEQENTLTQQQLQQDLSITSKQVDALTSQIAAMQGSSGKQTQIAVLQAQLNGLQQHYNQWETALAQLELTEAQSGNFLRVSQEARPPLKPVLPNVLLNSGVGLAAGLCLGLLLALLFEQLDTRVRTPEALAQLLAWPILGSVGRAVTLERNELVNPGGRDANVESYRILRTNIGFAGIDKPLHSLQVTSAMPGDGKSVMAANLAIFMAKAGKSTLLIDADLRRPVVHELFHLSGDKKGLSNAILESGVVTATVTPYPYPQFALPSAPGQAAGISNTSAFSLEPFMHPVGIPNLRVMPSGPLPPNSPELLDSKAMQRFFKALPGCGAEIVIFDSPPICRLSDASILAAKVDGVLLVVDASRARKGYLRQAKLLLTRAGAHVLGCVMNKQRRSRRDRAYSSYDHYSRANDQNSSRDNGVKRNDAHGVGISNSSKNTIKVTLDGKKGEQ